MTGHKYVNSESERSEGGPLIVLESISKVYDQMKEPVVALHSVDLRIKKREFVSIMGPSGSGKSTLLHILGAIDRPTEGTYSLEGVDLTGLKDRELARVRRDHFGFVFQSYNLFPELTAVQNVEMPMVYAGVPARQRRTRARELLEELGLAHRLTHRPIELSGGEQQRVAIARALANGPTLLLADEPTGNLPTEQGVQVMLTLHQLNQQGMTVILVTHDPSVAAWGRRLLTIRDGKIEADTAITEAHHLQEHVDQVARLRAEHEESRRQTAS